MSYLVVVDAVNARKLTRMSERKDRVQGVRLLIEKELLICQWWRLASLVKKACKRKTKGKPGKNEPIYVKIVLFGAITAWHQTRTSRASFWMSTFNGRRNWWLACTLLLEKLTERTYESDGGTLYVNQPSLLKIFFSFSLWYLYDKTSTLN